MKKEKKDFDVMDILEKTAEALIFYIKVIKEAKKQGFNSLDEYLKQYDKRGLKVKKETLLLLPMFLTILALFIISFYGFLNLALINAMLWASGLAGLAVIIIFLIYF